MSEDFVPWSERGDDDNVDDLLGLLADALEDSQSADATTFHTQPDDIVNELVSNVFAARGETGVLGHFIFAGEIIGENGDPYLMVVTSDNLPDWVARGMVMAADDYIAEGVIE